ncbi:sensor histidine kinase [Desulfatitalea alkaliphila]|uniref:histidine kinase n=1 Tax=Desulfatitalea alkaliphila TaxID=2929485 RepID=A0AA41UJH4_9BACT|nr:ATP-binding protein [Desulfatitalea alkaliphila]MCJ8499381.1 ATP-binding protein [Desulfatitalea alkaliphila]
MKRLSIHSRLVIAAFLVIGAVALVLGTLGIQVTNHFMHERFHDRIDFLARYLAMNSEVGVLISDTRGLNSLAHNLLGEEDVARVMILDSDDNTLVDLERPESGPLSMVETPVVFKRARGENLLFNDALRQTNPFISKQPEAEVHIGKVRIYFSTRGINDLTRLIGRQFLWFSVVACLVAGLVFFLVSRPMGTELKQLTAAAQQIGRGDAELRVIPGRLPETRALAFSFNAMLDSLEHSQAALQKVHQEMSRQKALAEIGKFSLMIAHEVKNPLAIIKSSLDILKRESRLDPENTMVGYIEDEIVRLNRLIEAFLQFSRPAKPAFRTIDLNQTLADAVARLQMTHGDNGITMHISPAPGRIAAARADRDLLTRAFSNIIDNACAAAGTGGSVRVSTTIGTDYWRAAIIDSGEGIDPAIAQRVFEPFFTTRSKGTGLGLAFAAQVILAHGGTIEADNAPEGGAVFTVRLPLTTGPPTAGPSLPQEKGPVLNADTCAVANPDARRT